MALKRRESMKGWRFYNICLIVFFASLWCAGSAFAQKAFTPKETTKIVQEASKKADEEEEMQEDSQTSSLASLFEFGGMIRFTSIESTYRDQNARDSIVKNEIRKKIRMKFGSEDFHMYFVGNGYVNSNAIDDTWGSSPYSEDLRILRNGMVSSEYAEFSPSELYLNYKIGFCRIRIGNQNIAWGTGDVNNPTSYFNPTDLREFIFKEEDELTHGVPLISAMFYFEKSVLELVFVPFHIPASMPSEGFWVPYVLDVPMKVSFVEAKALEVLPENFAYGARLSGNLFGADMSISAYHGPDKEPLLVPHHSNLVPNEPVEIVVQPTHFIINKFGFDFSFDISKFVVQFEGAYSPDKSGLPALTELSAYELPLKEKKSHYISYSTGFNYFIPINRLIEGHEGDSVLTMEWYQARYLDDSLEKPFITDLAIGRFEDGYFDNSVKIYLTGMYDVKGKGYILWPKIQYDFQNGLVFELSYVYINNDAEESLVSYYKDKDVVMGRMKYEY